MTIDKGSLQIKNVSGESYYVEEIDYTLADQEIVDLVDDTLANYLDYGSASRLLTECTNAKLYKDTNEGNIEIVFNMPSIF